jgi:hypothetical protein
MDGSSGLETNVHRGTAREFASPLLCTAFMSAKRSILRLRTSFFVERECTHAPMVRLTDGSLGVFEQFAELEADSGKMAFSRPAHAAQYPEGT